MKNSKFSLGYGKGEISFVMPEGNLQAILLPNPREEYTGPDGLSLSELDIVALALDNPIGSSRLESVAGPEDTVVIVTSDITRPVPSRKILPQVIRRLLAGGVKGENITVVLALGSHRRHTPEEIDLLLGKEITETYRCLDSNQEDILKLGSTTRNTPLDFFTPVVEADKRILIGNIEYHYFAGYSGGMKALMPGVSTRSAIQANHRLMTNPDAYAGRLHGNPVREDIDETYRYLPAHFLVNVILDEKKNIKSAFAGDVFAAHRQGCGYLDEIYKIEMDDPADIVVVSPGGYPKDINLYQAQKALDNAKHAVKEGGTIILTAACTEGFGESVFEEWMKSANSPEWLVREIERNFVLGGHKAAAIGLVLEKADIFLVSEFPENTVRDLFMLPFRDPEEALRTAFEKHGHSARVAIMPYGGATLPVIRA